MTVRARLVFTLVAVMLLVAVPAIYAVRRLAELRDIAFELRGQHAAASMALGRLQTTLSELDRFQRSYVATPGPEARRGVAGALTTAREHLGVLRERGYEAESLEVGARLDSLETASADISAAVESDELEEATARLSSFNPLLGRAQGSLDPIASAIDRRSGDALVQAQTISAAATTTTLLALLSSLLIALGLGYWTTRGLVRPVRRLRGAMATVAGGVLVAPEDLPYDRQDEIGDLSRSFRAMTQQLAELNRLRAEFISMASHDLKTPINVVSGYAELMQEGIFGNLTTKQREVLESIGEQTRVLTRLVTQILDISRMEAGGFRIELADVVAADLFDAVRRTFEALARQKEIDFTVNVDESVPQTIRVDPDRLRNEVLGNLLSNAFKFTPKGGSISVTAWGEGDRLLVEVADTGVGIPSDQLQHIFDKYYQVGEHARQVGTGLGLAIAREVMEAHRGTIEVRSIPEKGTTFKLSLPVGGLIDPLVV